MILSCLNSIVEAFGRRLRDLYSSNFSYLLQDLSEKDLADLYIQYMDATGSAWFSEIFWEANRRGLSLTDLEEIANDDNTECP